jgi:hypothetical protein
MNNFDKNSKDKKTFKDIIKGNKTALSVMAAIALAGGLFSANSDEVSAAGWENAGTVPSYTVGQKQTVTTETTTETTPSTTTTTTTEATTTPTTTETTVTTPTETTTITSESTTATTTPTETTPTTTETTTTPEETTVTTVTTPEETTTTTQPNVKTGENGENSSATGLIISIGTLVAASALLYVVSRKKNGEMIIEEDK